MVDTSNWKSLPLTKLTKLKYIWEVSESLKENPISVEIFKIPPPPPLQRSCFSLKWKINTDTYQIFNIPFKLWFIISLFNFTNFRSHQIFFINEKNKQNKNQNKPRLLSKILSIFPVKHLIPQWFALCSDTDEINFQIKFKIKVHAIK